LLADSRRFTIDQASAFQSLMWNAGTQSRGEIVRVSTPAALSYAPVRADSIGTTPSRDLSRYGVWYGAYGDWSQVSASDTNFGLRSSIGGAALGLEVSHAPGFAAGMAVGASSGALRSSSRDDRVDANSGHAGLYARGEAGGFNLASAVSYAFAALDSSRAIAFLQQSATGSWHAHTFAATLGASRPFRVSAFEAEPFARLDWYATRHGGVSESGAPGVNQQVQAGSHDLLTGSAGLRLGYATLAPNGLPARISATLGVRRDLIGSAPAMITAFEGAPAIPFAIGGLTRPRTALLAGAETIWAITAATSLKAGYQGAFASGSNQHTIQAAIRTSF
jgi:subtilase-type serine protease